LTAVTDVVEAIAIEIALKKQLRIIFCIVLNL
jgi:hypothetical protein